MVKRHYAIVTKEYKLVHFYDDVDEWELYDRLKDPKELKSEYDNPEYAEVVAELTEQLAELRVQYKDSKDLDQKYIDIYVEKGWREDIVRKKWIDFPEIDIHFQNI